MKKINLDLPSRAAKYEIVIDTEILPAAGAAAKKYLDAHASRIVMVSNRKVFGLYGETVKRSLESAGFEVSVFLLGDGEKYKSFRTLEKTLKFFSEKNLKRADAVVALGGGVVGDLAGFAAAVYLRGISFLQIPTTLLAMIDSSVGGKTGVNSEFGKNLIGAFHQPAGVLIDIETLKTLPRRELTAGFCEAVKQGAVSGRKLFDQTSKFLEIFSPNKFKSHFSNKTFLASIENLIAAQITFKAEIVMQDERENTARIDVKSRKILNFGHTVGHALEKITDYKFFKHGEAVGYGILIAGEIGKNIGIFDKNELKSLNDVLLSVGKLPDTRNIDPDRIFEALSFDKKTIGNSLQWILLEKIGKPKIVPAENLPKSAIETALKTVLQK